MKNIKYMLFILILLFFNIFCVHASCSDEEIDNLKLSVEDIKVIYKHKGVIETNEETLYNQFDVTVNGMDDDLYIELLAGSEKLVPSGGTATIELSNGKWNFEIYSNKCGVKIGEILVVLPRFNIYSLDPLCNGIDGDDFALCGKYYEYDVSYEYFKERVNSYRVNYDINDKQNENSSDENIWNKILVFITNCQLYILAALVLLLIILLTIIVVNKRKKRGVLK